MGCEDCRKKKEKLRRKDNKNSSKVENMDRDILEKIKQTQQRVCPNLNCPLIKELEQIIESFKQNVGRR